MFSLSSLITENYHYNVYQEYSAEVTAQRYGRRTK